MTNGKIIRISKLRDLPTNSLIVTDGKNMRISISFLIVICLVKLVQVYALFWLL